MSLLRSYLESNAILPASDLEAAARHQHAQGGSFDTALLELGLLTAADLDQHLGQACGLPTVPARLLETGPTRPWGHVPKALLDIGWVLPLALEDGQLLAAVHPDLPDARLGQLYRQIRGFTPMVTPECCLAKLSAERTGGIVAPRHAMLVLDVLDALRAREASGTTLVGVAIPAPGAPQNAPAAPAPAAFTIPYAAAGPQLAVHAEGPAGPPPPSRPPVAVAPPVAAADSLSETIVEPVPGDSIIDAAAESMTAAATISQPIPAGHDPAAAGSFPVVGRQDSAPLIAADSGAFPREPAAAAPVPRDTRPPAQAPAAPVPKDTPTSAPAAPVPRDTPTSAPPASATPVPKDIRAPAPTAAHTRSNVPAALLARVGAAAPQMPTAPVLPDSPAATPASDSAAAPDRRARPPSGTATAPAAQDSRPADAAPSPAHRSHPRSGGVSTSRSAPLPQLPLIQRLAPARAALAQARERDRITESLVRAAIQVAPRVALFGVKREGLRALAAPGSSLHLPRSLVIPIPDGSLLDRAVSGEIRLRLLTEPQLAFAVGRPLGIPCILEPVYAQARCVLMLYIDRSGGPFEASEQAAVRDLCDVARSSLEALLRIMGMGVGPRSDPASAQGDPAELPTVILPADPATTDAGAYVATPQPAPPLDAYVATPQPAPPLDAYVVAPQPEPSPSIDAYVATPEPSPSADAWRSRSDAAPEPTSEPPAAAQPTEPTKPGDPSPRSPEMDGVPELTRRPRRAVIALVNPIRREPAATEPARGWTAARDQYTSADAPASDTSDAPAVDTPIASDTPAVDTASTFESDAPIQSDPHAPTRRLPVADADAALAAAPVPSDSSATTADDTAAAPVPPDSPATADDTAAAPVPSDSPASAPAAGDTAAAPVLPDSPDDATATGETALSEGPAPVTADTAVAPVPSDSPATADTTVAPVPSDSPATADTAAAPVLAYAADTAAAPAAPNSSATATGDTAAAPVPSDSPADATAAPVPADSSTGPLADSPDAATPADSATDLPADPDPSASTSGLHMPNLVAPGVRRSAGKRGDRTRPVEPAVVIPYDLRRPEHRTSPPKPTRPAPGVQIPASLIAPAPLPGSTRRGKAPQHPTPPRAEDVTLNMPRLVRAPTSLPSEPTIASPEQPPAPPKPTPAAPQDTAPPPEAVTDLSQAPADADLPQAPADVPPPADLSEPPAAPQADLSEPPAEPQAASGPPSEPQDPDAALAAYLHDPEDPATQAALRALGPAVYPRIAARFPGPIDPRSASDVRSFPPPSVHGPLLRACVELGEAITPYILELLDHQRPQIRFYAAFLFQELRDPRALRPLAARAFDPDPDVRQIATRVLESFNRTDGFVEATELVRAALIGRDRDRTLLATEAAGTLRDTRAVPILIDMLSVRDKQIRETALEALCSITAKHHGYRPAKWKSWYEDHGEQPRVMWVMDALKHRDPAVRRWAADELTRVTGHRIPPPPEGEKITPRYVLHAWDAWWTHHGAAFR